MKKTVIAKKIIPIEIYKSIRKIKYKKSKLNTYSYKEFYKKQIIFIHIPKCAGVSVNQTLFGNLGGGHRTFEEYIQIFTPEQLENFFKCTIVRNPWERLVSSYFFLKSGGFNEKNNVWSKKELGCFNTFDEFVMNWLNEENIWKTPHFRPQYHYIIDPQNRFRLDFIGYLENIRHDFATIAKQAGVRRKLPKKNQTHHMDYISCYTEKTRERVAEVYAKDIEFLGYSFDNNGLAKRLAQH